MALSLSGKRRGFSLIELLVVLGIISILAALLLPALSSARRSASGTVCLNNIRQVNLGLQMFAEDHGAYPTTNEVWYYYREMVVPYLAGATNAFACPSDTFMIDILTERDFKESAHRSADYNFVSYAFNGRRPNSIGWPAMGVAELEPHNILEPSRTISLYELPAGFGFSWHKPPRTRHNLAPSNLAFVDGHVALSPIFWNGGRTKQDLPIAYDPPVGFSYRWSPR